MKSSETAKNQGLRKISKSVPIEPEEQGGEPQRHRVAALREPRSPTPLGVQPARPVAFGGRPGSLSARGFRGDADDDGDGDSDSDGDGRGAPMTTTIPLTMKGLVR